MIIVTVMMLIMFISVLLVGSPADYPTCSTEYTKVGCYKDDLENRYLSELLITDRDPSSPKYSELPFNWSAPFESMTRYTFPIKYLEYESLVSENITAHASSISSLIFTFSLFSLSFLL